jgi:hypothetical protein
MNGVELFIKSLVGKLRLGPLKANDNSVGVTGSGVNVILNANESAILVTIHSGLLTLILFGRGLYKLIIISKVVGSIAILLATVNTLLLKFK